MNKNNKEDQNNKQDVAMVLVDSWRERACMLSVNSATYHNFGPVLLSLVGTLKEDVKTIDSRILSPAQLRKISLITDAIQDGCAELFADWKDGMEWKALHDSLIEWQVLWFDQLRFKE